MKQSVLEAGPWITIAGLIILLICLLHLTDPNWTESVMVFGSVDEDIQRLWVLIVCHLHYLLTFRLC